MEEIGKALLMYMRLKKSSGTHAQAQEIKSLIPRRILNGSNKMLDYLVSNHRYEHGEGIVNIFHIKDSIKFAFGSDSRTVETKITDLKKYGILRPYGETFQFTPLMDIAIESTNTNHSNNKPIIRRLSGDKGTALLDSLEREITTNKEDGL